MRVLVAMSGGVDSSVAAAALVEQGHEVTGATMRLWGGESDTGCCAVSDADDARRVAQQLGIDHFVFNFGDHFERDVVDHYVDSHRRGQTPNPCIECNRHIKFDRLLRRARKLGFDALATGHHARLVRRDGMTLLRRAADAAKDQSYVLSVVDPGDLERCLFPVGELIKAEVRKRAAELGLRTAGKPDSQDVCFVTRDRGRGSFLGSRIPLTPAAVVDTDGAEVGRVEAAELVTVGQRKGLGLAGGTERRFVLEVDLDRHRVTVGPSPNRTVTSQRLVDVVVHSPLPELVDVQTSAHGAPTPARVVGDRVEWASPRPRVAPGQAVVLYDGDVVLGGGRAV